MDHEAQDVNERTRLLGAHHNSKSDYVHEAELLESPLSSEDGTIQFDTPVADRLPFDDYTTIDYLREVVKGSSHHRNKHAKKGIRSAFLTAFDSSQGWIAAILTGIITACVAAFVDVAVATVSDWKMGYCRTNVFARREMCCRESLSLDQGLPAGQCTQWHSWSNSYWRMFGIYVGWALLFGIISGSVTMLSKTNLPAAVPNRNRRLASRKPTQTASYANSTEHKLIGKTMYMAAGSGIPEIKSVLAGFVIPHLFDFKVLVLKAIGAIFAVPTGMNLGKEGPFVHISTCAAYFMARLFPKYRENTGKIREMLAAGCASGLSVAFGAPIGGVLFAYEEISSYFPRKVLYRAIICSLCAAVTLRELDPNGTGRLVMFETKYGTTYKPQHYIVFAFLGVAGGVFGGILCRANFWWSRFFRRYAIIKNHPVLEVFLVVLVTTLVQFPNPLTRDPGDVVLKDLMADCYSPTDQHFVCQQESAVKGGASFLSYFGYLVHGVFAKLFLTIITFGIKVPSGVIIPALNGGAFFGRLVGQLPFLAAEFSPGIFAMVGAGAFLAGVSRMTISLAVIMVELTGEIEFIVPNMIGILVAKWVADLLEKDGIYELAQTLLGHPFLDLDHSLKLVQSEQYFVSELSPPEETMHQITVQVPPSGCVSKQILLKKLEQLKERGLMDAGLVLVHTDQNNLLAGYLLQEDLELGLNNLNIDQSEDGVVRLLVADHISASTDTRSSSIEELDLSSSVDMTPLTVSDCAPMEYAVEMFTKLGLRYLITTDVGTGRVTGVVIKKRLIEWLAKLKTEHG